MIKAFIVHPIVLIATAGTGVAASGAMGMALHMNEMLFAGAAVLVASELSVVPLIFTKGRNQVDVSQAGLVSTVLHMFITAAIAMAVSAGLHPGKSFLYWLLAFYWMTLISVAWASVTAIRSAPVASDSAGAAVKQQA